MGKLLVLEQGEKYSDKKEQYFMVPNWLFDDGEYLDLDVYERMALIYAIRLVNKKDNSRGMGDVFFLSAEKLAKQCNFSLGKAKLVLKKLQDHGYIKKIRKGSNLTRKANEYIVMNLHPIYVKGEEVQLNEIKDKITEEQYYEWLCSYKSTVYRYEEGRYSHRKALPQLLDKDTGEVSV